MKENKRITLLLLAAALLTLVSCADQKTSSTTKSDATSTVHIKDINAQETVKKSAGVSIYGDPSEIKVSVRGDVTTLKPGNARYDKARTTAERIMLRVSTPYGEPPVPDDLFAKMMVESPATVQVIYRKEPVFTFLGTKERILGDKNLAGAKGLTTITFFIPTDAISIKPSTIYDGFYYGNVHMISTLTNVDLLQMVKELK